MCEVGFLHAGGDIPCRPHPAATQLVLITDSAVAQHCSNGDRLSQWRMANFDPLQNETTEPLGIKFDTDN